MSQSSRPSVFVRFGPFEVDFRIGELRKEGRRVGLQEQPFQVLSALLERSGEMVTRAELQKELWPSDTFVDFDHGLNSAVARLREALNDSAERPKYIETVARRGYRFIAPIDPPNLEAPTQTVVAHAAERGSLSPMVRRLIVIPAAVAFLACATWYFVSRHVESSLNAPRVVPLTSLPDQAEGPTFSPDGNYVAFARFANSPEVSGIYVEQIADRHLLQLTKNERDFFCCPMWSPDGRYIAFSRIVKGEHRIYTVSAIGGAERKLFSGPAAHPPLDWSADGRSIAFTRKALDKEAYSLYLISVESLETRRLSEPPGDSQDWGPAFSPDGKQLAFVRMNSDPSDLGDIFLMPASGGEPRRLTFDHAHFPTPPVWTRDGRSIVFSSTRSSSVPTLWRIPVTGGSPTQVPEVGVVTIHPTVSPRGHRLAYEQILFSSSIWSMDLGRSGKKDSGVQVAASKGINRAPEFSPDGQKIAFVSDRSGTKEIWSCGKDGSNLMRVTNFGGAHVPGPPRWSPDGQTITFDSAVGEHNAIFAMNVEGGLPRRLTHEETGNLNPSFSRDGRWIYFASMRSGEWQIWKMPSAGGDAVQITKQGGRAAFESADGKFIYYASAVDRNIWRLELADGHESPLSPEIHVEHWSGWALANNGIFFLDEEFSQHPVVKFFDFSAGSIKDVVRLERRVPWRSWISVSADGKFILYTQQDQEEGNIMLLENFR
jgi:Tol biopolymer transport system component/DNA-binding winged helix-turn-helix (wHTH) protein